MPRPTLRTAGAIITIGTDLFRINARVEVNRIAKLGLMSNLELLRAWSVDTPRAIFPARNLGRLDTGAEASFLVLDGDPLTDFAHTQAIVLRVKQGRRVDPRPIELPQFRG
jgi:imidazolonepropionase-like amidohydrolase